MSAPDQPAAPTPPPELPGPQDWTEEDVNAALQSAFWFDSNYSEGLVGPYRGMHVAIYGERIIAAACDREELYRLLDTDWAAVPTARLVIRYIPRRDEPIRVR